MTVMLVLNQDVINNFFYILLSIFLAFFLIEKKYVPLHRAKPVLLIAAAVSIVLCMLSPIDVIANCVHDMRQIPFMLGILYGGWPIGGILLAVLIGFRTMIYGYTMISTVVYITMFVLTLFFVKPFARMKSKQRVRLATLLYIILATVAAMQAQLLNNFQITWSYVINFILFPAAGMFMIASIVETLRNHLSFSNKMVRLEKMEVVSQLAASISHEVRNPLTVVKGFLQLFKMDGLTEEEKKRYIDTALIELDRAEGIISDYLTFAKPTSANITTIDVKQEMQRILDMLRPFAYENSVLIHEHLEECSVKGNVQNVQQVLLNIVKNAIESMPNGGVLRIQTKKTRNKVIIHIQDTGCGLTSEQRARLGEPYFSTKEKGTGLGLMVSYRIIEAMKGTIEVESQLGTGTTFTIALPVPLCNKAHNVSPKTNKETVSSL
ncbi:ATP-binding protein [Ectobacillus sp. JY-23]|uniref:ATP-binding protein n=1 Tax=Ectobacillus sp. JY-23 TaxID=2933872 RepID=UPI001FF476E8|nr:ATP-binding protein [Ectobacillus sp. JY-23]UOY94597.1 ATP-binding protein [Ectobacillus sp. JY-23]